MITNVIIVLVIVVIAVFAVKSSIKHFHGEGGCCGGGGDKVEIEKKELDAPVVEKKVIKIKGMHCENCQARVTRLLDKIDGASADVNLKKNQAVLSCSRNVPDEEIKSALAMSDYTITDIKLMEG